LFPLKPWTPLLETLEDRLTPALTLISAGGSLFVLGSTASPTVTVSSDAAGVTVTEGATSSKFAGVSSLNVIIQMTGANPVFNFNPGVAANGGVLLNVLSPSGVTINVAGTSNVNIGSLLITTGAGDDAINVDNVNPSLVVLNSGAGYDTVVFGHNAPVTVRGLLSATNVNVFGLGNNALPLGVIGPPVVVQGTVLAVTDFSTRDNNVDVEDSVVIQGDLFSTMLGPRETLGMAGHVLGNLFSSMGDGPNNLALITDGATVGRSVSLTAAGGASTTVSIGTAVIGGNLSATLGGGSNTFGLHGTLLGTGFNYSGGAGTDKVIFAPESAAPNARINVLLGAGNDTFTLNSNVFGSAVIDGGLGNDVFSATVPIPPTIFVQQF